MVKTICEQCGDRGFSVALIYCKECQIAAVHRYCIPKLLVTFEEDVIWYCVECERKVGKPNSVDNLNSVPARKYDSRNLEVVEATKLTLKKKNDIDRLKKKKKKKKKLKRRDLIGPLTEGQVRQVEISPCHHLEVQCSENRGEDIDQKFRRQRELDCSSCNEESESVKTKISGTAIVDCQNTLVHGCELHCSERDKNNDKLGRQIGLDGSSKAKTFPVVTNDSTSILQYHGGENDKGDNNIRRQKLLVRDGFDEEIESIEPKNSLVASNSLNIPAQSSNAHTELTTEVHCNQNVENAQRTRRQKGTEQGSPDEEAESAKHETSLVVTTSNINHSVYVPAQPIFQPIWNGSLCLSTEKYGTVGGLVAHLSTMASSRVFEEAKRLPELLCLELLPRSDVWPKNFNKWGPSDDDIALYLFPMNDSERVYESLVDDMISHNLAMRAILENSELLVFTSNVLPFQFWRFQLKFYLWGVFRGKQALRVEATQFVHARTWYTQISGSRLSHSGSYGYPHSQSVK